MCHDLTASAKPRRRHTTCLDLAQIVDLIDRLELILHALDRHILRALETLRLDHLGEGAFALFRYQAVLWRAERNGVSAVPKGR